MSILRTCREPFRQAQSGPKEARIRDAEPGRAAVPRVEPGRVPGDRGRGRRAARRARVRRARPGGGLYHHRREAQAGRGLDLDRCRLVGGVELVGAVQDQVPDLADPFNAHMLGVRFHRPLQAAARERHLDRSRCSTPLYQIPPKVQNHHRMYSS